MNSAMSSTNLFALAPATRFLHPLLPRQRRRRRLLLVGSLLGILLARPGPLGAQGSPTASPPTATTGSQGAPSNTTPLHLAVGSSADTPAADLALNASLNASHPVAGSNSFWFRIGGQAGQNFAIQTSTNLTDWVSLLTNSLPSQGAVEFMGGLPGGQATRFFRTVALPNTPQFNALAAGVASPRRLLVKPKAGVALGLIASLNTSAQVIHTFPAIGNLQVLQLPPQMTLADALTFYRNSGLVQYAEPDVTVHVLLDPNDPRYTDGTLWGLHNTGQYGGTPGADIHAAQGWDLQHTATNLVVAVIDTGARLTHEDLVGQFWTNPGEIPGNGVDDDQDGYVDDVHGINTLTGSGDPTDDHGHGTHVSGIIGATGNNGLGVVGVAWQAQLMELKFLDSQGNGSLSDAITCIDYARTHGAQIINASWGSTTFASTALHDAIQSARDAGIIFVAAAGNSAGNNDTDPLYPASYNDLDNVVAVTATDRYDQFASWANYGATNVDVAAPGDGIYSCWNTGDSAYYTVTGSSMSAAYVSGVCAVVWAHDPSLTYRQVINQVLTTADPLPALQGKCRTAARVDLAKALGATGASSVTADFTASPTSGTAPLTVQFNDQSTGPVTTWDWNFGDGSADGSSQNPSHTYQTNGTFTATLTVTGSDGSTSSARQTITATTGSTSALPVLTIAAIQPDAYVSNQAPATVRFHRTGDTSQSYQVYWSFSGTATNGVDYGPLPTNSPFPAGQADADLTIKPIDHGQKGDWTVIVKLAPGADYQIGGSNTATITIHGYPTSTSEPTANFTANPASGTAPLTVQFTDQSTGSVTSRDWNFGDGSAHSAAQNPSHTYQTNGTFTATLTVTGSDGATSSKSATITVQTAAQPVVTVAATVGLATIVGPVAGVFTISRTGDTSAALAVSYTLGGTGQNGVDYQPVSGSVTIPAGAADATVLIAPIVSPLPLDLPKSVVLTLSPNAAYQVGAPNSATVSIVFGAGLSNP
jgi:PKD repeat protein